MTQPLKISLIMTAAAALTLLGLFLHTGKDAGRRGVPPEPVTIAFSTLPYAALAHIAQQEGYFQAEGLNAVPRMYPYGKLALQAVMEGTADFATVAETPVMFAVMNGEEITVVAGMHGSTRSHAVIARKDAGILTPKDMAGRRLATTLGTSAHFFLDAFLITRGIDTKMIMADLSPEQAVAALERGEIDAAALFDPQATRALRSLGNRGIAFYDEDIYRLTFTMVADKDYVRSHPERVRKVIRALIRAEEFAGRNPEQARAIVSRFAQIDPDLLRESWQSGTFRVTLDQSLILSLEDESRWAMNKGLTERRTIPNYLDYIDTRSLEAEKPGAVKILR